MQKDSQAIEWLASYSRIGALLMICMPVLMLGDWWWRVLVSTPLDPATPPLSATSALGFALSGIALFVLHSCRMWARPAGIVLSVAVIGTGLSIWLPGDLGIEQRLMRLETVELVDSAVLISDLVAFALVGLGCLGLTISARLSAVLRDGLAVILLAVSMAGLASYSFVSAGSSSDDVFTVLALHKSVFLLFATLAWMAAAAPTGLMRIVRTDTFGGLLARRLLLPALLLPVAFTFAFKQAVALLAMSESLALTLAATFTGGATASMVWWSAALFDRIERQREEMAHLRGEAMTDALTGLANRRALDHGLADFRRRRQHTDARLAFVLVDIDNFKSYNDAFGHPAGDEALRTVGRILRAALRATDIPARYGGEEFAVLMPDTDVALAWRVAERICDDFRAHPWPLRAVTVSIGVADSHSSEEWGDVVERADKALYQAKAAGRDRVVRG